MNSPLDITDELIERIAERITDMIAEHQEASIQAVTNRLFELLCGERLGGELIDAAEVARRFGVSRDFVYEHADDLGVVRLGDGPKARLRFDPQVVAERLNAPTRNSAEPPQRRDPRPTRRVCSTNLLPIKE